MLRRNTAPTKSLQPLSWLFALAMLAACGGGDRQGESQDVDSAEDTTVEPDQPVVDVTPGITVGADRTVFRTEPITLDPGQERFVCYTQTLEEDLVVDGYATPGGPIVHHVVFAKTVGDEPEGLSECDVLFRFVWEPIFLAGAGASELQFPEGVGQILPAGTRLLTQLHLLNASSEPVTDSAVIEMHRSALDDPSPINTYAVGNFDVSLPPQQSSKVESVCTIRDAVDLVAAFPHMHLLGTSLTFEVGPSEVELTEVYEREPYDFDDQRLELLNLTLNAGDVTRVTCNYDNPTDQTITFGESTTNEMCFLVGFATGRDGQSGCVTGTFPADLFGDSTATP